METNLLKSIYPKGKLNLSFAGCGFLGIYHVGVASCFKKYAPQVYEEKIAGASAGALVACALIADLPLGDCTTFVLNLSLECRKRFLGPFHPNFHIEKELRKALDKFLPKNVNILATNKLFISLSRLPDCKNELVSQFDSKEDLIDALICSSYVPFFAGIIPPCFRGKPYMDGAFSDNLPVLDNWTIKVSPFAGESDICPNDQSNSTHHINISGTSTQLNCNNAYRATVAFLPPPPEILSQMCQNGFEDALRFMRNKGLISCQQHVSIHSALNSSHPFHLNLLEKQNVRHESKQVINSIRNLRSQKTSISFKRITADNFDVDEDDDDDSAFKVNDKNDKNRNISSYSVTTPYDLPHDCVNKNIDNKEIESNNDDANNGEGIIDSFCNSSISHHHCVECELMSKSSKLDGPPSNIIKALDDACMEGNKGFMAQFYKYRFLPYIAAPYIIPCSFTYAMFKKLLSWAPSAPTDIKWFTGNAYNLLIDLFETKKIENPVFKNERLVSWLSLLANYCGIERCHKKEFYSLLFSDFNFQAVESASALNGDKKIEKEIEKQMGNNGKLDEKVLLHFKQSGRHDDANASNSHLDLTFNPSHIDSYDNFLHINNQMDAILSYCYLEEKNLKKVKVIEIMPLK